LSYLALSRIFFYRALLTIGLQIALSYETA